MLADRQQIEVAARVLREGKLVAYENSAENGQRIHVVEIPVVLSCQVPLPGM